MAFSIAHLHRLECSKTELDLFALPTTQTAIERSQWVEFRPLTTVSDGGPIEFIIPGSGEDYCDLSEIYLMVTAKITKPDGTSLNHGTEESPGPDAGIGPVNLWLHSLFSQVEYVSLSSLYRNTIELWTSSEKVLSNSCIMVQRCGWAYGRHGYEQWVCRSSGMGS